MTASTDDISPADGSRGDLVRRANDGDQDAIVQLVDQHMPALRRWASRLIGPRMRRKHDTGDIMSTVIRRLLVSAKSGHLTINDDRHARNLFFRAISNAAAEKGRAMSREPVVMQSVDDACEVVADTPMPHDRLDDDGDGLIDRASRVMDREIDKFVIQQRAAGKTLAAIGAMLGVPETAVQPRWSRILKQLRQVITEPKP